MKSFLEQNISHDSLITLFSQAPVAVALLIGDNYEIHNANPQMLELWGKDSSVIGKSLFDVLPEITSQGFADIFKKVYRDGELYKGNKRSVFLEKYGQYEEHFFNFIYAPVYNDDKKIIGISIVATEVTEHILSEKKLKDTEYRFENFIKKSDYPIAIYRTEDFYIEFANEKMLKTWGKDASVIGMKLHEALPELEGQPFLGILKDIFKTGVTYSAKEDRADLVVDGKLQTFYYNFSYKPLKNRNGEVYAILNMAVDVTDLVLARKEIQQREEKFRDLADSMPQFVWTCDNNGEITYMNNSWYKYTGSTAEENQTELVKKMMKQETAKAVDKAWAESVKTKAPFVMEYEFEDPQQKGSYRWFLGRAVPNFSETGEVKQWTGTFTDIDEFKQLESQKDNFLGIASHELKTPLTSLKLYTQFIKTNLEKAGDPKNAEVAGRMDYQIDLLTGLINELLDVTKIQKGQIQLNETLFDFDKLVDEVVEEQQMTARHRLFVSRTNKIGEVFADRHRISQVMANLISNAIKYSPEADEVHISTGLDGSEARFNVKDFGIGIPEDQQSKVFDQYYRISASRDYTFPGLGLGLYISSEIIKRTGGKIFVTSVEGEGSDFCFRIPKNKK